GRHDRGARRHAPLCRCRDRRPARRRSRPGGAAMSVLPYPLLSLSLVLMWMALNSFTIGHLLLGSVIATFASWGMAALRPHKPHIRRWHLLPYLIGIVLIDIVRS